jgi:hypothetical protein
VCVCVFVCVCVLLEVMFVWGWPRGAECWQGVSNLGDEVAQRGWSMFGSW